MEQVVYYLVKTLDSDASSVGSKTTEAKVEWGTGDERGAVRSDLVLAMATRPIPCLSPTCYCLSCYRSPNRETESAKTLPCPSRISDSPS
jgi:hypothetical protein